MAYELGFPSLLFLTLVIASFIATLSSLTRLSAWLYTFFVFVPSYYIIYQSWIFPFYISPLRSVPTVPGFPLWGQTHSFLTEEAGIPPRRWHKQHGPIVRWFLPFGVARLSVIDDEALKQIFIRNPYRWPKPPNTKANLAYMLGDGLLTVDGDAHVQQRKVVAPAFSISSIKSLTPIFWRKALLMSRLWRAELRKENVRTKSIEVLGWSTRTTLDIIGEAGLGNSFDSLTHPETPLRKAYKQIFKFDNGGRLFFALLSVTPLALYLPIQANHTLAAARGTIIRIASEIIRDKQSKQITETPCREKDILSLIMRANLTANGRMEGKMTFETMRDQVMTFIGAGHETTGSGIAWTLLLLSKYPSTQEKLRREIQEYMPFLFSDSREDESWLSKIDEDRLPYLNNVCRESLRYIPPIPFTRRANIAEDQFRGYRIPAGTTVYVPINAIHRAPEYWGETADVFDPDRWDHLPATFTANAYLAFLNGPRGCIGKKFAETEMKALLCCLLSAFRFEMDDTLDDPENWKMWKLVLRPKDGITLKVTPLV